MFSPLGGSFSAIVNQFVDILVQISQGMTMTKKFFFYVSYTKEQ